MQSVPSRIWTRVAVSISYDDTLGAPPKLFYILFMLNYQQTIFSETIVQLNITNWLHERLPLFIALVWHKVNNWWYNFGLVSTCLTGKLE